MGFAGTALLSYYVAKQSYLDHIKNESLPLASRNIYSEIQKDIIPAVIISKMMANDAFVQQWYEAGEQDVPLMKKYLLTIQEQFKVDTVFFISENTRNYYHSVEQVGQVSEQDPADSWYFDSKASDAPFIINVDSDFKRKHIYFLFVNYNMRNKAGKFSGVIGTGLSLDTLRKSFQEYQETYQHNAYFVDKSGHQILNYDGKNPYKVDAHVLEKLNGLNQQTSQQKQKIHILQYANAQDKRVFASIRYIPELKWYLVVEEKEETQTKLRQSLLFNLMTAVLMTLLLMLFMRMLFGNYHQKLHDMATKDSLTGLFNRQSFETMLQTNLDEAKKRNNPLSLLMLDVDHFKRINDELGHAVGDDVLKVIATTIAENVPETAQVCRWGGEEFMVILPDTTLAQAELVAQDVATSIHKFKNIEHHTLSLSVSCGVCFMKESDTEDTLFKRLDAAMYKAKNSGRNTIIVG